MSESGNGGNAGACLACASGATHEPWTGEDAENVETALRASDADRAGHWPTVAGWLACEVRRLRARVAELEAAGDEMADWIDDNRAPGEFGPETGAEQVDVWRTVSTTTRTTAWKADQ